ncbi:FecCD family ABC transporter permease [Ruania halotolerans]|uniref:FecCD family ABC transporter permease n=1 Tax=Ruania halotolerans TaxID=2897773 RepID=UPI001E2AD787|nr:iron ABC transporter permease [Ruania halotolerans]UFU06841.1 iron ABC transporter permease [Ruania halotolerans]
MTAVARPLGRYAPVEGAESDLGSAVAPRPAVGRDRGTRRRARPFLTAAVLLVALLTLCVFSLHLGQYQVPLGDVASSVIGWLGLGDQSATRADGVLWDVRLPRILAGVLVGAGLGTAGAITQGLFGNPLAEPSVVGITAGAGVGAAAATVLGTAATMTVLVPAAAFGAGIVTTLLVWALASMVRGGGTVALVLVGIAVNAVAGAASSLLIFLADSTSREAVVFWQLGSLNGVMWTDVVVAVVLVGAGLVWAFLLAGGLDSLALGERAAAHTGVNLRAFRVQAVLAAALLTAAAVAVAGIIGFVGLIVPHLLRLVVGPRQRYILPLSALGGAVLIAGSDLVARTLVPFVDLPIGALTAVVGGPVFFLLLRARIST